MDVCFFIYKFRPSRREKGIVVRNVWCTQLSVLKKSK